MFSCCKHSVSEGVLIRLIEIDFFTFFNRNRLCNVCQSKQTVKRDFFLEDVLSNFVLARTCGIDIDCDEMEKYYLSLTSFEIKSNRVNCSNPFDDTMFHNLNKNRQYTHVFKIQYFSFSRCWIKICLLKTFFCFYWLILVEVNFCKVFFDIICFNWHFPILGHLCSGCNIMLLQITW